MMIGEEALTTYWSWVPSTGFICGVPSILTGCGFVSDLTPAVWGMLFATTASCACCVPGTDALTFSIGLSSGIDAKSFGSWSLATKPHGPFRLDGPSNQRPVINAYAF